MKPLLLLVILLASTCSASLYGAAVSSQYQHLDPHSHTYSYGYADPNSQKHESRSHDGITRGSYSYVDGHGHVQSVAYTADPHSGFHAVGTNLPKGPPAAVAPYVAHAATSYAAAHHYGAYPHAALAGGHHYVALTPAGVPVDTPEVQHAKAAHAVAYAAAAHAAAASPDPYAYAHGHHHLYKRSLYPGPWAYSHGPLAAHVPLTAGGVPLDTPDVQAAKAEHYAAHAKALGHLGHGGAGPVDTAEVAHAKAAHFAAHAAARTGHPLVAAGGAAVHGYHVPVIHNGVPVDTPEVQHAKAAHYAAVADASARAIHAGGHDDGRYDGRYDGGHYGGGGGGAPLAGHYATGYAHKGPIHIPVIHNGVPVEPPEVQYARAAHLSAKAAAAHAAGPSYYGGGHDDGRYHGNYDHHY